MRGRRLLTLRAGMKLHSSDPGVIPEGGRYIRADTESCVHGLNQIPPYKSVHKIAIFLRRSLSWCHLGPQRVERKSS